MRPPGLGRILATGSVVRGGLKARVGSGETIMATKRVGVYRKWHGPVPTDASGKPIAGVELVISAVDGQPDVAKGLTDSKGRFTTGITWKSDLAGRSVTISSGDLKTTVIESRPAPGKIIIIPGKPTINVGP